LLKGKERGGENMEVIIGCLLVMGIAKIIIGFLDFIEEIKREVEIRNRINNL
jgi:hypothetical protein